MRIALFTDTYTPDVNGVVTSVVTLQRELEKHGHTVFVVTSSSSLIHSEHEGNVLRLPAVEVKKMYGYHLSGPFSFTGLSEVKNMDLDLIHVHTEFGIGTFARICSHMLNIPMVATYHTMYEDYTHYINLIENKTIDSALKGVIGGWSFVYSDLCNELIAPSEKTKEKLLEYGVKGKDIHVIPTGLDLDKFSPIKFSNEQRADLRKQVGVKENEKMLLFVGRIAEEKSVDVLIKAMKDIKEKKLSVHLVIVGGGPALDLYKEMAKNDNLEDVVTFTDKVMPSDVPIYYAATDMFASASLSETQGLTFIEAMSSNTAVFAADHDVLADLIVDGESGYFFDNPQMLVDRIEEHLNKSEDKQEDVCKQAIMKVEPFNANHFYEAIIGVYEKAIENVRDYFMITNLKMKHDNYFEVKLKNDSEEYQVLVKLETFYHDHLQIDKLISRSHLEEYLKEDAYNRALLKAYSFMAFKDRTRKEMYDHLTQKSNLSMKEINDLVERFENEGYINDEAYVVNQIESMRASLMGRRRIQHELIKRGIPYEMVNEELGEIEDSYFVENAKQVISNTLPTIKGKNSSKTKEFIHNKLERLGYNYNVIAQAMSEFNFDQEEEVEVNLLAKEYEKQFSRMSNKYQGHELKAKLITALIRKGYEYDLVKTFVEERLDGIQID